MKRRNHFRSRRFLHDRSWCPDGAPSRRLHYAEHRLWVSMLVAEAKRLCIARAASRSDIDVGNRLPAHQRANSKGQTWMARQLGVSPNTLRGWLAGRRSPRKSLWLLLERIEKEAREA